MAKAIPFFGAEVVGAEWHAAQHTYAFVFANAESRARHIGDRIPDTNIVLYAQPQEQIFLRKYTLQGCPTHDAVTLTSQLETAFATIGELVLLVPMVYEHSKWRSPTWHATVRVHDESVADPPAQFTVMNTSIICDIPGRRRFCKHCMSTTHVKASCRQGQRLRVKERSLLNAQRSLDDFLAKSQNPTSPPPPPPTPAPPTEEIPPPPPPPNDVTMEYVPSYQQQALDNASGTNGNNDNDNGNGTGFGNNNYNGNVMTYGAPSHRTGVDDAFEH